MLLIIRGFEDHFQQVLEFSRVAYGRNFGKQILSAKQKFAQAIAGAASVEIDDGSVTGLDVNEVATKMIDPLAEPLHGGAGSTSFLKLAGTLAIEGSALRADNLTAEGKNFRVAFAGRGSLLTGFVEARAKLSTWDAGGKNKDTIPVMITGTWREPVIAPDQPTKPGNGQRPVPAPPRG